MAYVVTRTPVCDRGACKDPETGEYLPVEGYRLGRSTGSKGGRPKEFLLCRNHAQPLEELLLLGGERVRTGASRAQVVSMEDIAEREKRPTRKRAAKKAQ